MLGPEGLPVKCLKYKWDFTQRFNCPCVYHLANNCSVQKVIKEDEKDQSLLKSKNDLGLFMRANLPVDSEMDKTFLIEDTDPKNGSKEVVLLVSTTEECIILKVRHKHPREGGVPIWRPSPPPFSANPI